jgi:hypothetical protein
MIVTRPECRLAAAGTVPKSAGEDATASSLGRRCRTLAIASTHLAARALAARPIDGSSYAAAARSPRPRRSGLPSALGSTERAAPGCPRRRGSSRAAVFGTAGSPAIPNARLDRSERSRRRRAAAERGLRSDHAHVSELPRSPISAPLRTLDRRRGACPRTAVVGGPAGDLSGRATALVSGARVCWA